MTSLNSSCLFSDEGGADRPDGGSQVEKVMFASSRWFQHNNLFMNPNHLCQYGAQLLTVRAFELISAPLSLMFKSDGSSSET